MGSDVKSGGSGGGSERSSPVSAPTAAVCCMCGDRGLLPELFRCAACAVRSQHTYCTERYPKAESYGTCNWCLRADKGGNHGGAASGSVRPSTARAAGGDPASSSSSSAGGGGGGRSVAAKVVVAARGHFAADLSKPIKKPPPPQQRRILLRRSASDVGTRVRGAGHHDAPPSPGVARGRPRVRRYKLLEEVITTS